MIITFVFVNVRQQHVAGGILSNDTTPQVVVVVSPSYPLPPTTRGVFLRCDDGRMADDQGDGDAHSLRRNHVLLPSEFLH